MKRPIATLFSTALCAAFLLFSGCAAPETTPSDRPAHPLDLSESRAFAEQATQALGAGEAAGYEAFMDSAVSRRPHQPAFVFHAGRSKLAVGDTAGAVRYFERLVAMGMTRRLEGDPVLSGASDAAWFSALKDGLASNASPSGDTRLVGSMGHPDMVPEGVAHDAALSRWFVGSVREGVIVEASTNGERILIEGLPSVMGMVFHEGRLIVAVSQTPHQVKASDVPTGVLILDATDGSRIAHHPAPVTSDTLDAWVGEVHVSPDGVVYATDSVRNVVYRVPDGGGPLEVIADSDWFNSLQGIAQRDGDAFLYIADYTAGLLQVDPVSGSVSRVATPADATLLGMDGLDGFGNGLLAIQNGTNPQRVIQIVLAEDGRSVEGVLTLAANITEFGEPTRGVVVGSEYIFVANSYWPHLGAGSQLDSEQVRERPTLLAVTPERF